MSLYHQILDTDPDNIAAQRGLERIVEHFLEAASTALERQQYTRADSMLSRARLADRHNPNIEPIETQLRLIENARREKVRLDWRKLAARSPDLNKPLARLGGMARQAGCRATITVSNDAEGRWVYQQMSRSPGKERIRARMQIASPASVEIVCFDPSASEPES